jgi:hypothetical protein
MNERIKELYKQASFDPSVDSEESMVEKFAELIVRECCKEITYASVSNEDPVFAYAYTDQLRKIFSVKP